MDAVELLDRHLAAIDHYEPHVHAWVLVDAEGARKQAKSLADELARGRTRGPLHGVPVGIKDIVDVQGWPTRAGSRVTDARAAQRDAPVVAQLRQAGAIILGKTVTTEFASFDPSPTRNPWNLDRTPGGSSSGSAAAVACGMCVAAIGSQTGGSITRPASFCGVAGLKPTFDAVSLEGIVPLAAGLDHAGALARTADELSLVLEAIRRPGVRFDPPAHTTRSAPPRIGWLSQYVDEPCSLGVRQASLAALDVLRSAGAHLQPVEMPASAARAVEMHRRIMAHGAAQVHRVRFAQAADQYGPHIGGLIREGLELPPAALEEAWAHQERFATDAAELAARYDALVMPATVTTAPELSSTGDPRFNSIWSLAHLPTVSTPCGLAADGLPCSLQWIGTPWSEFQLLAVAAWAQTHLGPLPTPPLLDRETKG